MAIRREWRRIGVLSLATASALLCAATTTAAARPIAAARPLAGGRTAAAASLGYPVCTSWKHHKRMAARISRHIENRLAGHTGSVAIEVHDSHLGVGCWYHHEQHFYSASAVKATILAALMRKAQQQHRRLSSWEKSEARLMITQSDNSAASALYSDVGLPAFEHFLKLAKMRHTIVSSIWGITGITAHDETLLLQLLMTPGHVLTNKNRRYELRLMGEVIPSQSWGVKVGVPRKFSWHIKNGWAPLPYPSSSPWVVNSIGCFLYKDRGYTVVVLTQGNNGPTPGIQLVQSFARVINRGLNPGAKPVWSAPPLSSVTPAGG